MKNLRGLVRLPHTSLRAFKEELEDACFMSPYIQLDKFEVRGWCTATVRLCLNNYDYDRTKPDRSVFDRAVRVINKHCHETETLIS